MIISRKFRNNVNRFINNINSRIISNKKLGLNSITIYCHACYAYQCKKYYKKLGYNVSIIHDDSEEYTNTTISWGDNNE